MIALKRRCSSCRCCCSCCSSSRSSSSSSSNNRLHCCKCSQDKCSQHYLKYGQMLTKFIISFPYLFLLMVEQGLTSHSTQFRSFLIFFIVKTYKCRNISTQPFVRIWAFVRISNSVVSICPVISCLVSIWRVYVCITEVCVVLWQNEKNQVMKSNVWLRMVRRHLDTL